jgi:hypothetical protein
MNATQSATTTTPQPHVCHADDCNTPTGPAEFMCPPHWPQVPSSLRESIEATYRPGHEPGIEPSNEYLAYAAAAIAEVAHKENRQRKRTPHTPSKRAKAPAKPVQLALFDI